MSTKGLISSHICPLVVWGNISDLILNLNIGYWMRQFPRKAFSQYNELQTKMVGTVLYLANI